MIWTKTAGCQHLAEFPIDEILALRESWKDAPRHPFVTEDGRHVRVRMSSIRYHLFARSRVCACCGIEGTVMLLDVHGYYFNRCHFNLYAVKNRQLVLMTKDHIIPKSQGGLKHLDNLQVLCTKCNHKKNNQSLTLNELREMVT